MSNSESADRPSGKSAGRAYEASAASMLNQAGLRIIEHNYSCKLGEIDLVCEDAGQLIFVEVRRRSNPRYGSAAASVTRNKQRKLIRTAQHFLRCRRQYAKHRCRFDVVAFDTPPGARERVQWIKNAFTM